ncbi:MAG: helix-turn-helix domain-containing protein [Bacteroidales bacterium]
MQKRIELILKTQNLTVSQFADQIGIQRSGMSHILAGRNKPSLDFVTKVLQAFPAIRTEWLLFGQGSMYVKTAELKEQEKGINMEVATNKTYKQSDLYEEENAVENAHRSWSEKPYPSEIENYNREGIDDKGNKQEIKDCMSDGIDQHKDQDPPLQVSSTACKNKENPNENIIFSPSKNRNKVDKIVFFYTDGSFEEYFSRG